MVRAWRDAIQCAGAGDRRPEQAGDVPETLRIERYGKGNSTEIVAGLLEGSKDLDRFPGGDPSLRQLSRIFETNAGRWREAEEFRGLDSRRGHGPQVTGGPGL